MVRTPPCVPPSVAKASVLPWCQQNFRFAFQLDKNNETRLTIQLPFQKDVTGVWLGGQER